MTAGVLHNSPIFNNFPENITPEMVDSTLSSTSIYYVSVGIAAISALTLALHGAVSFLPPTAHPNPTKSKHSGAPLVYGVLRSCCCVALFSCSLVSIANENCGLGYMPLVLECAVYAYCTLLAISAVLLRRSWGKRLSVHLEVVLLSSLAVYGYSTVVPILLSVQSRFDNFCDGSVQLWVKGIALVIGAILLPLLTPRLYVPIDSKNPASRPNPEQTASLLSLSFFSFLDPLIFKASKVSHLSVDELPPLSDDDQARILREKHIAKLDPLTGGGKRHVFWNMLRVFWRDLLSMTMALVCHAITSFIPAIATNQLLIYLETRRSKSGVLPPWFWILLLFVGPVVASIAIEVYMRIVLRTFVRIEALFTELIYEHAVRARVKSNVEDGSSDTENASANGSTANVNTLITVDLNTIEQGLHFLTLVVYIPVQIVICIVFLYKLLGWSAFVGIGLTILLVPVPGLVGKAFHSVQENKMKKTDARVQVFTDVVNVLRMVKLFGWEEKMSEKIAQKRTIELKASQKARLVELLLVIISFALPFLTMLVTFTCYAEPFYFSSTLIAEGEFNASVAFPALVVFDLFRNQIQLVFFHGTRCIAAKVSLDRINRFLQRTELLDKFSKNDAVNEEYPGKIGFHNMTFTWSNSTSGNATPSEPGRKFILMVQGDLQLKLNALNLVIGPTGSGKTSLLLALLGEMHPTPLSSDAWFNLPRAGGVAYAAQESWVLNETIKDNILFGSPYNEERYKKVIKQCALERDLSMFAAGDRTEIGERGVTLSGGQKARLTLARAIYSQADILLLDDILAALDVHTSKWIVEECLSGDLVQGRTVIMVSHNITLLMPLASRFIKMKDGVATLSNNVDDYLEANNRGLKRHAQETESEALVKTDDLSDGKLIVSEEIHQGNGVGWPAVNLYTSSLGGNHPFMFFGTFFACILGAHLTGVMQTWYLGYWASEYDNRMPIEVPALYHLGIYGLIFLIWLILLSAAHANFIMASVKASKSIHNRLVESVLAATIRWLDETPVSRVIARATQDIGSVDLALPSSASQVFDFSINMLFKIGGVIVFTPAFFIPSLVLTGLGLWVSSVYLKAQLSIKREMSNAKAPVVGLAGAASTGIVSIRAYSAQDRFADILMTRIDHYSRSARVFYNLQRWMAMRTETLAGLFSAGLAWYLIYFTNSNASNTGFLLNLAVTFSSGMVWWVIQVNNLEVESNSLERLESYLRIDQEARLGDGSIPPAFWPSNGELRFENFTAKYSPNGPEILHGLSFHIKSGERIGVVGRTGSGKSTLTLAMLRCILTGGKVFYDGILTSTLNLDALRSQITIIPQTPELISGSLRQNLDPFEEHDDQLLNDALKSAGLTSLQEELDVQDRIDLDTTIASGGTNISLGQRQIIALARALVRRSKLLILDEATSAIDYKTDTIIQNSLRNEYSERDATIITIAHRLQTVMDADRIMVLDAGRIVEFDSPFALLQKKNGHFWNMVEHASDKQALLAMVKKSAIDSRI